MDSVITWTLGSNDPDAEANLARIGQWWTSLANEEIIWQQRSLEGDSGTVVDWEKQALDETFTIQSPSLRGITLYWFKPNAPEERNISAGYLQLDLTNQRLDLLPSSGRSYQLRVTLPKIVYQKIQIANPQIGAIKQPTGAAILLIRDEKQRLEIQIDLNSENTFLLQKKLSD